MRRLTITSLLTATSMLWGCGTNFIASRETNPVLQDFAKRDKGDASVLSTTASRRIALMAYVKDSKTQVERLATCSEPPPDVGESFARALAMSVELSVADKGKVAGGYADKAATAIAPLMVRSQGLQLLRDSNYAACVDALNGWISTEDYIRLKYRAFDTATQLIALELPYLVLRTPTALAAPATPEEAEVPTAKADAAAPAGAASAPLPATAAATKSANDAAKAANDAAVASAAARKTVADSVLFKNPASILSNLPKVSDK